MWTHGHSSSFPAAMMIQDLTWHEGDPGASLVDLDPRAVGDLVDETHEARLAFLEPRVLVPVPDLAYGETYFF